MSPLRIIALVLVFCYLGQSCGEMNSSIELNGFGYEVTLAGLDSMNYNIQKDQLKSKEYFETLQTEIDDIRRTIQNTETLVLRLSSTVSKLESNVEMNLDLMAINITRLLFSTGRIQDTLQLQPSTETMNDLVLRIVAHNLQNKSGAPGKSAFLNLQQVPQTCSDVTSRRSGIYELRPQPGFEKSFEAYCDLDYEGGKWTVIQNRYDGTVDFYRGWQEYEDGFGSLGEEFWLGLKKIHELTHAKPHELHIVMEDFEGTTAVAKYSHFQVGGLGEKYALKKLGKFSGDAGDSLSWALNAKFSTLDADHDTHKDGNCAVDYNGGWWYKACHESNLNGLYMKGKVEIFAKMMCWKAFKGYHYGLKSARMMIRVVSV
ncbi:ficolin-2-like [Uranotaenia lowii]|uniref:ficolin-2-like n=1 Tax=Uranotaenia lowii TaxID=190385 RepID=UPI0024798716|nr:ficolin-2-like [Uranotaenia lowii]